MSVKNLAPAEIQISAEQLIREARERQVAEDEALKRINKRNTVDILDNEELSLHQSNKRAEFEKSLRRTLTNLRAYILYAKWEEEQKEFRRARSIFERAVEVDYRDHHLWLQYVEFETRNNFENHARNIFDRAVTLLPRVSALWYKYVHFEESRNEIDNARAIFTRWIQFEPPAQAWYSYINFEVRYKKPINARIVFEELCGKFPTVDNYVKYAAFEEKQSQLQKARDIYTRAITEELPDNLRRDKKLLLEFSKFEERCGEIERARVILSQAAELEEDFLRFQRRHYQGFKSLDQDEIYVRRFEKSLSSGKQLDYDLWFDYAHLLEGSLRSTVEIKQSDDVVLERKNRIKDLYERAVSNPPDDPQDDPSGKGLWRRYVFLWVYYAVFMETVMEDVENTRRIYEFALQKVLTHQAFTFGKLWVLFAKFEIRQGDVAAARKVLGRSIGVMVRLKKGKKSIFDFYLNLEQRLGETDRCRQIFQKYIQLFPSEADIWLRFANFEMQLLEDERVRAIHELCLKEAIVSEPEKIWKSLIEFEKSRENYDEVDSLYQRLLRERKHFKVSLSYAKFLFETREEAERARLVLQDADNHFKDLLDDLKDDWYGTRQTRETRMSFVQGWCDLEGRFSDEHHQQVAKQKMPTLVTRERKTKDGEWEEYQEWVFPEEAQQQKGLKLLQLAGKWKNDESDPTNEAAQPKKKVRFSEETAAGDENEISLE